MFSSLWFTSSSKTSSIPLFPRPSRGLYASARPVICLCCPQTEVFFVRIGPPAGLCDCQLSTKALKIASNLSMMAVRFTPRRSYKQPA
jgi:hypothetical protein